MRRAVGRGDLCSGVTWKSHSSHSFVSIRRYSTGPKISDFAKDEWSNVPSNVAEKIGKNLHLKKNHPLNILKRRVESFYVNKNAPPFKIFDSLPPFVSVEKNFDSLLVPSDHPSRSKTDTYYLNKDNVLRCHTSAHQTEMMNAGHSRFLVFGDVYRRDEIDASHYPIFHQVEGVKILPREQLENKGGEAGEVEEVVRDLKGSLEELVVDIFGERLQMKWVDAYFPFTHPSFELEVFFQGKWMEVLGSGVIHQTVMKNCNLGDRRGWAFGIGLERLAMTLFHIPDIRLFWSEDNRFLDQFASGQLVKFKPYSKYPPVTKDIAFWIPNDFHSNNLFELIRDKAGDLVESVELVDSFQNPKTQKKSHCYRITYRSMDRNLTNKEIDSLQEEIRKDVVGKLAVELR